MHKIWSIVTILLLVTTARAEEKPAGELPVKAKLIAKKATYTLDLGGMTAADYKKTLADPDAGRLPPVPKVEMTLELTNTSDKDVEVWVSGTPVIVMLDLKGPGAVSVTPRQAFPGFVRLPTPVTLAPGKSHAIPLTSLSYGRKGIAHRAYWAEPGEYTLSASLLTALKPPPKGVEPDPKGFGKATLTSEPIKIKVEAK